MIVEGLVTAILDDIEALRRATPPPPGTASAPAFASPPARATRIAENGEFPCTPGDERSIRGRADAFTLHWNNADAQMLASLWSEDGDIVHPDGLIERGREMIRTNRAALFMRQEYRGSKHPMTFGNVRCLSSDIAVVDGKWELRGVTDAGGKILPTFEGLLTLVMKRNRAGRSRPTVIRRSPRRTRCPPG